MLGVCNVEDRVGERHPSTQIAELIVKCLEVLLEELAIFVRMAHGELGVNRLHLKLKPVAILNLSSPKTNLPIFPIPLIGQERELEQLSYLLCDPQCRLLILVCPGGIGKTRLAIETAALVQDFFADGVYFVSLASVIATSFIVPMVAGALGFTFQTAKSHRIPSGVAGRVVWS